MIKLKALIDLDPIVYRIGFACQAKDEDGNVKAEPISHALRSVRVFVDGVIRDTKATSYAGYLSGKGNFRTVIDPEYKMNRVGFDKPIHFQAIREFLIKRFKAVLVNGQEPDDIICYEQKTDGSTIICTVDKDLLMKEGKHYNYVTKLFKEVTKEDGIKWFYTQLLMGDSTDNIAGIKGIGKAKAIKLLDSAPREDWDRLILEQYEKFREKSLAVVAKLTEDEKLLSKNYDYVAFAKYPAFQRMVMNEQLLWMVQSDLLAPVDFWGMCNGN
jgi:5'-3' exonuclease